MKFKSFAVVTLLALLFSLPAEAANSVTLRNTVELLSGAAKLGDLYEYKVTYDTGASALQIRAGATGKHIVLVGIGFGVSANASVKIISNSVDISGFAIAANHANPFVFRYGQVMAIGTLGQDLSITCTQAFVNNLGSVFVLEMTPEQLAQYLTR